MEGDNPYQSPQSMVAEPPGDENLAGRGVRLGAVVIDAIIAMAISFPLMYLGGYWQVVIAAASGTRPSIGLMATWALIGYVVFILVQGYPLHASGQTWGKRLTSIKIVDLAGNKPSLGKLLLLRYLPQQMVMHVPIAGRLLVLVDVLMIFRKDRRCLHDLIAGTRVVVAR